MKGSAIPEAVHVDTAATLELVLRVLLEARLLVHVDPVRRRAREEEREVERVAVVGRDHSRLEFADVLEEASQCGGLVSGQRVLHGNGSSNSAPRPPRS